MTHRFFQSDNLTFDSSSLLLLINSYLVIVSKKNYLLSHFDLRQLTSADDVRKQIGDRLKHRKKKSEAQFTLIKIKN